MVHFQFGCKVSSLLLQTTSTTSRSRRPAGLNFWNLIRLSFGDQNLLGAFFRTTAVVYLFRLIRFPYARSRPCWQDAVRQPASCSLSRASYIVPECLRRHLLLSQCKRQTHRGGLVRMSSKSRLWAGAQVQCTPQESGAGGPWSLAGAPVSVSHCALEDILLCTRMMLRAHTHTKTLRHV
jgi:hypothetical protein